MDHIKPFEPLFGEWYAESFIGAGSFGRVYKIYKESFGRRFYSALKYISVPADSSETVQHRLNGMDNASIATYYEATTKGISDEIELMYKLRGSTNIVIFEDSAILPKKDGMGYDILIRMELLTSLTDRMLNNAIDTDEVLKVGTDICSALAACKKQGVIHRDVKPENIFVSNSGDYKLGDFGIARQLEKTATFMSKKGTYNYMAPEVYKGEKYGASCDTYSLGIVLYRLLNNGRLPFLPPVPQPIMPDDVEAALTRRMKGEQTPAPCNADEELSAIVLKACAYDPKDRYASAEEFKIALQDYSKREHSVAVGTLSGLAFHDADTDATQGVFSEMLVGVDSSKDPPGEDKTVGVFGGVVAVETAAAQVSGLGASAAAQPEETVSARVSKTTEKADTTPAIQPSKEEKKKTKISLIVGVAAAVLAGVIGLVALLHSLNNKNSGVIDVDATIVETTAIIVNTSSPVTTTLPPVTFAPVTIGGVITFGHYEQDNNMNNGTEAITWIVLTRSGNKALIISQYAIDCQQYNNSNENATWENCSLRQWLNDTFINVAFNSEEQSRIISSNVSADRNPSSNNSPGNSTIDKVFLLSITEVNKYFGSDNERKCYGTRYCYARGANKASNGNCWWWLRSPGGDLGYAADVRSSGAVYLRGSNTLSGGEAIRPALWIDLG